MELPTIPASHDNHWFITGATRGIGAEIAKAALAAGDQVVATGRNPKALEEALGSSDSLLAMALEYEPFIHGELAQQTNGTSVSGEVRRMR